MKDARGVINVVHGKESQPWLRVRVTGKALQKLNTHKPWDPALITLVYSSEGMDKKVYSSIICNSPKLGSASTPVSYNRRTGKLWCVHTKAHCRTARMNKLVQPASSELILQT